MIADAVSRKPLVGRESRIDDTELSDDITALVDAVQLARDGRSPYRDQSRNLGRSYNETNYTFHSEWMALS